MRYTDISVISAENKLSQKLKFLHKIKVPMCV